MNKTLVGMLMILAPSTIVWVAGTLNQRIRNSAQTKPGIREDGFRVKSTGMWSLLFGVKSGEGWVFLRPLPFQICAVIYLIVGSVAVLGYKIDPLGNTMAAIFVFGCVIFGLSYVLADTIPRLQNNRKGKRKCVPNSSCSRPRQRPR